MAMVQAMPVAVVARMIDEWDTKLWRVIHPTSRRRVSVPIIPTSPASPSTRRPRGGATTMCLFVDLVRRRVLFVAEGKDAGTVDAFARTWRPMAALPRPSPRCAST